MAPEPKKQATKGKKQIYKDNQDTIVFYTAIIFVVHAIYSALTWFFFWSSFTFWYQALFAMTAISSFAALAAMKRMAKARISPDGNIVDGGVDLNMTNGLAEHLKDIILLLAIIEMAALISNYFWLGLLVVRRSIPDLCLILI